MEHRHLFLFGGSPPFTNKLGHLFSSIVQQRKGRVGILFVEQDGWEAYMQKYTSVLQQYGIKDFFYFPLSQQKLSNFELERLRACSGIVIGGGNTELYQKRVVRTNIGDIVKSMYQKGIPVAGFSAGALISPVHCVIPPIDNELNQHLFLEGLGLISNAVVSVHFTKWNEKENLLTAMERTNVSVGYGIDDESGIYFTNERYVQHEGNVYTFNSIRR
jgi:cyanophycinase